jgi:hypothetical protein
MNDAEFEQELKGLRAEREQPRSVDPATPEAASRKLGKAAGRLQSFSQRGLALSFLAAIVATVVLQNVSWGPYILYPLALLGTWAHEMGHGLTGLLCGGEFDKLVIYSNLGGTAFTRAPVWARPLVSAGGLLGPAIAGGVVIVLGAHERLARHVLAGLAVLLWLSLALWVRNLYGVVSLACLGAVVAGCSWWAPRIVRVFLAQLIGVQLCLASLKGFDYMFTSTFERGGKTINSDTQNIAEAIPGPLPYWFYGALVAGISLLILGAAFYWAWIRPLRADDPHDLTL